MPPQSRLAMRAVPAEIEPEHIVVLMANPFKWGRKDHSLALRNRQSWGCGLGLLVGPFLGVFVRRRRGRG